MHKDPSVFVLSLQWASVIRSNGEEKKNMAGIRYQQSVLTPPLSGSFCSPTPPSSFFANLGPRLSLSSILVHFTARHPLSSLCTSPLFHCLAFFFHFFFFSSSVVCWHALLPHSRFISRSLLCIM